MMPPVAVSLAELAGERRVIAGALGKVLKRHTEAHELGVHVMGYDARMRELLEAQGLEGKAANSSGTTMIINFRQFMERMRPYFEERVGTGAARSLVFTEQAEQMIFAYGGDAVVAEDAGQAVQLIFGTLDGAEEPLLNAGGRAGELLRRIFPLQGLWYGLNYM